MSDARAKLAAALRERPRETLARMKRMLRRAAKERSGVPMRERGAFACIEVLAAWLGPKKELPRECDGALAFTADRATVRKLLSRIPMARRVAMFDAWIREGSWSKYLMPYLDLAPKGAEVILADARARKKLRETLAWDGFSKSRSPIVKRYRAIAEREDPEPPPKPARRGSFRFVDPVSVWPTDYDALDDVGRSQWRQAAGAYVGVRE